MRIWAASLLLALAACRRAKPGDLPQVRYGEDSCARCGMAVSEERYASGYVDDQGRSVVYDDVGEFLQDAKARPELVRTAFVHDAQDGRWVKASAAVFARFPALATPMGSGFAAFASEANARAFGRGGSKLEFVKLP